MTTPEHCKEEEESFNESTEEVVSEFARVNLDGENNYEASADPSIDNVHPASVGETLGSQFDVTTSHPAASTGPVKDHKRASELKAEGNRLFAAGEYHAALKVYTDAIATLPEEEEHSYARAVFHSNRAACHMRLEHYEDAIDDCTVAVELSPSYLKAFMRRSQAYEALNELDSALKDMNQVVAIDPSFTSGVKEQARLDTAVKKRNEELKDEMLGKLKSLGNTVLGKFGMSLDNFKVNQDPNTGSYR